LPLSPPKITVVGIVHAASLNIRAPNHSFGRHRHVPFVISIGRHVTCGAASVVDDGAGRSGPDRVVCSAQPRAGDVECLAARTHRVGDLLVERIGDRTRELAGGRQPIRGILREPDREHEVEIRGEGRRNPLSEGSPTTSRRFCERTK